MLYEVELGKFRGRRWSAFTFAGLLVGVQNLNWLAFDGGVHDWLSQLPSGRVQFASSDASFQSLAGSVPIWVHSILEPYWSDAALVVSSLAVLITLAGALFLAKVDSVAAACLTVPLVAGAFVCVHDFGGSGAELAVAYLAPITCALAAYGASSFLHYARSLPFRFITPAILCALTVILIFRAGSVVEGESVAISNGGILPPADLALSKIASVVPFTPAF